MQQEIWTPKITSQDLYDKCNVIFNKLYSGRVEFKTILKRNPENLGQHIVLGYTPSREEYYAQYRTNPNGSFEGDLANRVIETSKKPKSYYFAVNKNPIVKGAILLVHDNENLSMTESDIRSDFEIWSEIAQETGLRIFANYPGVGASVLNHQHAQAYPFEVPLEYFLQNVQDNTMVGYPGRNHVYKHDEVDGAVEKMRELLDRGEPPSWFLIAEYIGLVERQMSEEASGYIGNAPPSGSAVLGIIGVGEKRRFDELKETSFKDDWVNFIRVLIPKD